MAVCGRRQGYKRQSPLSYSEGLRDEEDYQIRSMDPHSVETKWGLKGKGGV